jgi:hypothetical protein
MIEIDDSLFALPAAPAPERRGKRGEAIQRNGVRPTILDCFVAIARRKTGVLPDALSLLAIDGGSSTLWRRALKVSATP